MPTILNTKIVSSRDWPEWKPSEERALTGEPIRFTHGMSWEMDERGNHRIVESDGIGGDWAQYNSIAVSASGTHICLSAYYDGGLPVETILRIVPEARAGQEPVTAPQEPAPAPLELRLRLMIGSLGNYQDFVGHDEDQVFEQFRAAAERHLGIEDTVGFMVVWAQNSEQQRRVSDRAVHVLDRLSSGGIRTSAQQA